ncbi:MAG: addiction module protein [Desulfobacterales bacterium]|nr:addiction module protein [Desulfobacterales bacterium]
MMTEKEIISAALIMSAESRIAIIDHLIASLTETEKDETEALWAKEAEDRISAYDRGEISSAPGDRVLRNIMSEDS